MRAFSAPGLCVLLGGTALVCSLIQCGGSADHAPQFHSHPTNVSAKDGETIQLSVSVKARPAARLQWLKNGQSIPGATGATYSFKAISADHGQQYRVLATNSVGLATSNPATLSISGGPDKPPCDPQLAIKTQPKNQAVKPGEDVTFYVELACAVPGVQYQWRANNQPISGANESSYTLSNAQPSQTGHCFSVEIKAGNQNLASENAYLTVSNEKMPPAILEQPKDKTVQAGDPVTFSVGATGNPAPSYQWYKKGQIIPGATGASCTLAEADPREDAGEYWVVLKGAENKTVTSSKAKLIVNNKPIKVTLSVVPDEKGQFNGSIDGVTKKEVTLNWGDKLEVKALGNIIDAGKDARYKVKYWTCKGLPKTCEPTLVISKVKKEMDIKLLFFKNGDSGDTIHSLHMALNMEGGCFGCHDPNAPPKDPKIPEEMDWTIILINEKYLDDKTNKQHYNRNARTCSNVTCHGSLTTPCWYDEPIAKENCAACHLFQYDKSKSYIGYGGSHKDHKKYACAVCHDSKKLNEPIKDKDGKDQNKRHFGKLDDHKLKDIAKDTLGGSIKKYEIIDKVGNCTTACHPGSTPIKWQKKQ